MRHAGHRLAPRLGARGDDDGVTGFVVDDVPGAVEAVRATAALDRRACRRVFDERFDAARMASDYLAVYRRLVVGEACPSLGGLGRSAGRAAADPIHHQHGLLGPVGAAPRPRGPDMAEPVAAHAPGRPPEGDPHHILAASGLTDDRTRVLKHGDTFAVFDHFGDIKPGGLGEEGLYHDGTRYLSCLILELDGQPPFFLGSTVRDENDQLSVALTNPDLLRDRRVEVPLGTLHLAVRTFLWQGACHWQLRAKNHGPDPVETSLCLRFQADFADIFEVRGMKRDGPRLRPPPRRRAGPGDARLRRPRRQRAPDAAPLHAAPGELASDRARFELSLRPQEEVAFDLAVACLRGGGRPRAAPGSTMPPRPRPPLSSGSRPARARSGRPRADSMPGSGEPSPTCT